MGGGVDEGLEVGVGVGEGLEVGVGVGVGEGETLGSGVDEGVGVGVGVGVGEGLEDVESVGEGVGVGNPSLGPAGSPLSKFVADITYAAKEVNKKKQINETISSLLCIFHLHWNLRLISMSNNKVLVFLNAKQ